MLLFYFGIEGILLFFLLNEFSCFYVSTLDLRERLLRYLLSVTETGGEVREDSNVSILS